MRGIIAGLIAAILVAACANAEGAKMPRDGDYLSTAYLERLAKTKSHNKAGNVTAPQMVGVSRENGRLRVLAAHNWHEGTWATFEQSSPPRVLKENSDTEARLEPIDETHFRFAYTSDAKLQTYTYVGNIETFLAERLLVGTYLDQQDRQYVFGADGRVQFPKKTFRYEIYTDLVFENSDLIRDIDASKPDAWLAYGFAWKGTRLFLYATNCNSKNSAGCIVNRKHPMAVLRKVSVK